MHAFTSITSNYLPKARVLASTLKKHNPDFKFHLLLSDKPPPDFNIEAEPFDTVINVSELSIPGMDAWIFKHRIVEMCTAVKGYGFLEIIKRYSAEKVFYFDPDMAVFKSLEHLLSALDTNSVILTPHQTIPEESYEAIIDNEICSLKHGIYNLGFLGVRSSEQGMAFVKWWASRLHDFCYDDISRGLFTDQRWVDLAPAFFPDIGILREPVYNVATWNLTHRTATGTLDGGIKINGQPLCFYHFSGFDSGDQEVMLNKYIGDSHVLRDLRNWYISECEEMGQNELAKYPCIYNSYDNEEQISDHERILYRSRVDLHHAFPNPFATADVDKSYYHWYQANVLPNADNGTSKEETVESLRIQLTSLMDELQSIKQSRSWLLFRKITRIFRKQSA